jgi:hypothetical protein
VDAVFLHTAYRPAHFCHIVFPGKANTGKFRKAEALKRILEECGYSSDIISGMNAGRKGAMFVVCK